MVSHESALSTYRVVVTGATGFIGSALVSRLRLFPGVVTRAVSRPGAARPPVGVETVHVTDIGPDTRWASALAGADVVVHAAARVHRLNDVAVDPMAEYRRVNVQGTLHLARQAAAAGARRLIFLSSIKVNGDETAPGAPFRPDDAPAPSDAYGMSKQEAEDALRTLASATGIDIVVIRPPLVYGPGVKANFLRMMRWVSKGLPLPLGSIRNKRSLVALDNLVDLILTCIRHPAAGNQLFLASDGEDLSTPELLTRVGIAVGRPVRLIPVPVPLLATAAAMFGKREISQRLCGSLQVDISKNRMLLGWVPPVTVDSALRATAQHFLNECARH